MQGIWIKQAIDSLGGIIVVLVEFGFIVVLVAFILELIVEVVRKITKKGESKKKE